MFRMNVTVTGLETITAMENRITKGIPSAGKRALDQLGKIIIEDAQRNVPVDTGRLKTSIKITRNNGEVLEGGAFTEYARFVEFGTRRTRARNYMTNAFRSGINQFQPILISQIRKAIGI